MMIKFLAHGTGSAAKAADYLTRERFPAQDQEQDQDQEKNPEEVKVLRGNPDQVAAVADSLEFEHKYTSGVIAWSPEDAPSDAQIDRVGNRAGRFSRSWATSPRRAETSSDRSGVGTDATGAGWDLLARAAVGSTCMSWRREWILRPARA